MDKKKYGLFIPKKNVLGTSTEFVKKPSVFDEDSDSEKESNVDWVKRSLKKEPFGGGPSSRQAKSDIQKVLAEDPTVYQYDEVYDELQKTNDNIPNKKSDRKPKYIQSLKATAERRKRENERRLARQIQKERDAEGDEFADKEVFVTSAYKKKLEEMKKMDEEDKHMEILEDIGDVTKQRDMVGFYRHLYRATVTKEDLQEPIPSVSIKPKQEPKEDPQDTAKSSKPRQYRRRKSSESSEGEPEQSVEKQSSKKDNLDADSDLSLSDDEKEESEILKDDVPDDAQNKSDPVPDNDKKDGTETTEDEKKPEESDEKKETVEVAKEAKPKVSIWVKRTTGEVFDAALERYYQRKAERLAAAGS